MSFCNNKNSFKVLLAFMMICDDIQLCLVLIVIQRLYNFFGDFFEQHVQPLLASFLALLPRLARLAVMPFCLFASPPPSLPLYLSLECRCLVKITLAMPCYANDYQLSTCLPLLLQQLPIQTCQKKRLSCIINK